MRFHRRSPLRPLAFLAIALLLLAAVWFVVDRSRPQVADVFPPQDAFAIPAQAPVRLTFDRPMNQGAVEGAFVTDPVRTGRFAWDGNTVTFTPDEPWPRGASIHIRLAGARASSGVRQSEPADWSFRTAPTLLAYLWPSSAADPVPADLYVLDPESGDIARLTETDFGVLDFSLTPDGLSILLSLANRSGGADVARLDLITRKISILLECSRELCSAPQSNPSGSLIAYENITAGAVFIMDSDSAPTLVSSGRFPKWSPDGRLLFYEPVEERYVVFNPSGGQRTSFPNTTGEPASWAPDSSFFLAPAFINIGEESFASHTIRYSFSRTEMTDLTLETLADDNSPAISPDGSRIALARRSLAPERWTPGRQLWTMSPDGQNAAPLTDAPVYQHTAFSWHPDNNQIAFVRSNQADLNEAPEIWLTSVDRGSPVRLVINGFAPQWLP